MDTQDQPTEGRLIEEAREHRGLSQNEAARQAEISGTRWRQIVRGAASGGPGIQIPVHGNAKTMARMAQVVGLQPSALEEAGRGDVAQELIKLGEGEPTPSEDTSPEPEPERDYEAELEAISQSIDELSRQVEQLRHRHRKAG